MKTTLWALVAILGLTACSNEAIPEQKQGTEQINVTPEGRIVLTGEALTNIPMLNNSSRVGLTDSVAPRFIWDGNTPIEVDLVFTNGTKTGISKGKLYIEGKGADVKCPASSPIQSQSGKPAFSVELPANFTLADIEAGNVEMAGAFGIAGMNADGTCKIDQDEIDCSTSATDFRLPFYFARTPVTKTGFKTVTFHYFGSLLVVRLNLKDKLQKDYKPHSLMLAGADRWSDNLPFSLEGKLNLLDPSLKAKGGNNTHPGSAYTSTKDAQTRLTLKNCVFSKDMTTMAESPKIRIWILPKEKTDPKMFTPFLMVLQDRLYHGYSAARKVKVGKELDDKTAYRWDVSNVTMIPNIAGRWAKLNVGELNKFCDGTTTDDHVTPDYEAQWVGDGTRNYQFGRNVPLVPENHTGSRLVSTVSNPTSSTTWRANVLIKGNDSNGHGNWYSESPSTTDNWKSVVKRSRDAGAPSSYVGNNDGDPCPPGFRLPTHEETLAIFPSQSTATANNISERIAPNFDGNATNYSTDYKYDAATKTQYALKMKGTIYANAVRYRFIEKRASDGNNYGCLEMTAKIVLRNTTIDEIANDAFFTEDDEVIYFPAIGSIGGNGGWTSTRNAGVYWTETVYKSNPKSAYDWFFSKTTGSYNMTSYHRSSAYPLRVVRVN